jgi:hypothetical protein
MNVNSSGTALVQCTDAVPTGNVQDFSYGFNLGSADNGNLASMVAAGTASTQTFSRVYGYDSMNRLASMSAPGDGCLMREIPRKERSGFRLRAPGRVGVPPPFAHARRAPQLTMPGAICSAAGNRPVQAREGKMPCRAMQKFRVR